MPKSLHSQVRFAANNRVITLANLPPNQRDVALRLIEVGELIESRCKKGYTLNRKTKNC